MEKNIEEIDNLKHIKVKEEKAIKKFKEEKEEEKKEEEKETQIEEEDLRSKK